MKKMAILLIFLMVVTLATSCVAPTTNEGKGTASTPEPTKSAEKPAEVVKTEPIKLTFWHSMSSKNGETLTAIVEEYNKSQNKYFIEMEYQGSYEDTVMKLKNTPEGMRPDLVQLAEINTCWMAYSDYYVPVQDYIDKEGFDVSDYQEAIMGYYTINGKLLSMPFNCSVPCVIYNIDAFNKAGVDPESLNTLDGVLEASRTIVDKGICRYGVNFNGEGFAFENYFSMLGAYITDNQNGHAGVATKLVIDENGSAKKLFGIWYDIVKDYSAVSFGGGSAGANEGKKEISAGNVAMYIGSCGAYSSIKANAEGVFDVGIRALPKINENDPYRLTVGGGSLWIINNGKDTKGDAAWDFLKFCASPKMQAFWASSTGYLPVSKSAQNEENFQTFLKNTPGYDTVLNAMLEAKADWAGPIIGVSGKWRSVLENELQMLLENDKYTIDEAVESICSQINEEIRLFNETNILTD